MKILNVLRKILISIVITIMLIAITFGIFIAMGALAMFITADIATASVIIIFFFGLLFSVYSVLTAYEDVEN